MLIYRASLRTEADGHRGYVFHASRRAAKQTIRDFEREHEGQTMDNKIDEIMVVAAPSRAAIIEMLNDYASHPNNG